MIDLLDPKLNIAYRLYREHCLHYFEGYVKDLSLLGRELKRTIIIDNSPLCYFHQKENAIPISSWMGNPHDKDLMSLIPTLCEISKFKGNIVDVLKSIFIPTSKIQRMNKIPFKSSTPSKHTKKNKMALPLTLDKKSVMKSNSPINNSKISQITTTPSKTHPSVKQFITPSTIKHETINLTSRCKKKKNIIEQLSTEIRVTKNKIDKIMDDLISKLRGKPKPKYVDKNRQKKLFNSK